MKNPEPPRFIPREGITGYLLPRELLAYLNWEGTSIENQNRERIVDALREIIGGSYDPSKISARDWERLAEATLTIGSKALDRIALRLRMIGQTAGWGAEIDYRSLASLLHTAVNQGRKLKNSSAQRRKCVKAVLGKFDIANQPERGILMDIVKESNFKSWSKILFVTFVKSEAVKSRFLDTYQQEWELFIDDAFEYFFQDGDLDFNTGKWVDSGYTNQRYEKFLSALISDTSKTNVNWAFEKVTNSGERVDIAIDNGITIDLKKRPDYFAFIVNIPVEFKSNFREIPLALMNLLEKNPGFKYVDISQPVLSSNQIEIQIHDKYEMEQIGIAQEEILKYFSKQF